jgi:urea carboxylase
VIRIVKPGLETTVQDFPGRKGCFGYGFAPSGPIDHWSFRLANLLVGNPPGAAALECPFIGPTLEFERDTVFALTGAEMAARLDGTPVPLWRSALGRTGQQLVLGRARTGARCYIALAGGIATEPFLGSRSTYVLAGVGGLNGGPLRPGDRLPLGPGEAGVAGRVVPPEHRPALPIDRRWTIEVVPGPNDDWIDAAGQERFLSTDWLLSARSNRVGFRLEGPQWSFADKAIHKAPEHGSHPSNTIDHGYPIGAINLCGQTPIILLNDTLTLGGFINPYTVISAAFWKLGQSRPNERYRFQAVSVREAQALRRGIDGHCRAENLAPAA